MSTADNSDRDFLRRFRRWIYETRQATFSSIAVRDPQGHILYHTTCSDPSDIDAFWDKWRSQWPHLAAPEKPVIRTHRDIHEALDRLQRELERWFGPELPAGDNPSTELTPPAGGDPTAETHKVSFDIDTHTVNLDGTDYKVDNPKAFDLFKSIWENRPQPITRVQLGARVSGCKGVKTIRNLLNTLPVPLCNTVKSGPNGYWFDADGKTNTKRHTKRTPKKKTAKKGHT